MNTFINKYWKTLLFFALVGLIGGFFTGIYLLDSYPADIQQQIVDSLRDSGLVQIPVQLLLGILTAVQSMGYGFMLGAAGIWLSKKIGLWKDERTFARKPLMRAVMIAMIGGFGIILPDLLFFGKHIPAIMDSYAAKPSVSYLIAMITYGGVIEEVMLRLFLMSLIAFVIHMLFRKQYAQPATWMLVTANVVSTILFAAGHLPATAMLFGLTPMIVFRCFLLNGSLGLFFGWLYRKHGLRYAMIAHGGCHVISKLIWIFFV